MLDKVLAAKNNILGLSVLDYTKRNVKLSSKLPYYIENTWRDAIKQWRHTHGEASYLTFLPSCEGRQVDPKKNGRSIHVQFS